MKGELFSKVVDNGCLDEADALFYFRQILEGIMYCHERKLCHRDMKLENLLLDQTQQTVKITDFGFAKNLADGAASTVLGTAVYVAPEVLNGSEYDGFKVDMWACGVILFAMVAGCYPFDFGYHGGVGPDQKGQNAQLMRALMKAEYDLPSDVAAPIADLLTHLIQPDPAKRFSAVDALKHPWIEQANAQTKENVSSDVAMSALTNLQNFNAQSKLKQATYAFIASQLLSKQEKEQIDKVFRAMDLNGDGKLQKDEIKKGYAEFFGRNLSDQEVDEMFAKIDLDGNGTIDYTEFVMATID